MCSYQEINQLQICKYIFLSFHRYIGILYEYQGTRSSWSNTVIKKLHERNVLAQNENTFYVIDL